MSKVKIEPNEILKQLREFVSKSVGAEKQQKREMKKQLNSYLGKIIPEMCDQLNEKVLNNEKNIAYINSLCYVFGDIHGNVHDVYDYEKLFWSSNEKTANYVFIGDFVDRGKYGVEVCVYLFALKMLAPEQFTLIRGNHEIRDIQKSYTFFDECIYKYGDELGKVVWNQINKCFDRLPLAAVIDNKVICCHGGVPKGDVTVKDILNIPRPLADPTKESKIAEYILWNDPIESMTTYNKDTEKNLKAKNVEFVVNRARGVGHYYTAEAAKRFLDTNGFDYMIRAHEAERKGFKFTSNNRVITVFSSSNYGGMRNTTACARVSSKLIEIILVKQPSKESKPKRPKLK